jgi:hypothetical protein
MGNSAAAAETRDESRGGRERRKQERFACNGFAEVVLEDAAFLFRGTILDLSLTGCYVQSSARLALAPGASVELRFSVKGDELRLLARLAIVRPGKGAGFEFFAVPRDMQSRLASLIYKLANPADESAAIQSSETPNSAASSFSRDLWHRD